MTATATPRIALIHALAHSIAPVNEELARQWPQCTVMNLLDDSLSADLAREGGGLDERDARTLHRARRLRGRDRRAGHPLHLLGLRPVHRVGEAPLRRASGAEPNEAMIDDAVREGRHIGLLATLRADVVVDAGQSFRPTCTCGPRCRTARWPR